MKLVEHHTKYKEIHGYDKTIWLTPSQHKSLHIRLRREGKCNIPPKELLKISQSAYKRTEKGKKANYKSQRRRVKNICFYDGVHPNVRLYEFISYNEFTGNVWVSSGFMEYNNKKLREEYI